MPTSNEYLNTCTKCKSFCCTLFLPPVTTQERQDILDAGNTDHFIKLSDDIYQIKTDSTGVCPYLSKDYSCTIQDIKPKLCRIWPVIPHDKYDKRGAIVIKCPLFPMLSQTDIDKSKKQGESISCEVIQHLWNISEATKDKYKVFDYEEI